jgi:hypothetical protein
MATIAVASTDTTRAVRVPAMGGVNLCTAQTGTGDSTNVADRGGLVGGGAVVITNVAGATPTVTVNIQGSVDGKAWFNVPYALVATPRTFGIGAITITAAATTTYILQELIPWRYLKLVLSANTNETLTADFYQSGS